MQGEGGWTSGSRPATLRACQSLGWFPRHFQHPCRQGKRASPSLPALPAPPLLCGSRVSNPGSKNSRPSTGVSTKIFTGKRARREGGERREDPAPETFPPSPARPRPSKGTSERRSEIPPRAPCRPCRGRPYLPTGRSVPDVLFPSWRFPERRPRRRSRSTCGPFVGSTIANATGRPAPVPAPRGS